MDALWLIGSVLGLAGLITAAVKVFILDPYTDRQYRARTEPPKGERMDRM